MDNIAGLIERLTKAEGPDRQLDRMIEETLPDVRQHPPPRYTGSSDAALTLMSDKVWLVIRTGTQSGSTPSFEWPIVTCGDQVTGRQIWGGQAKTLPLTLCIAALKAIASLQAALEAPITIKEARE